MKARFNRCYNLLLSSLLALLGFTACSKDDGSEDVEMYGVMLEYGPVPTRYAEPQDTVTDEAETPILDVRSDSLQVEEETAR